MLDNCEHLLDECAGFVANILRAGGGLRIVATSREPLALRAERLYRVHALPDVRRPRTTEQSVELASVRLLAIALPAIRLSSMQKPTRARSPRFAGDLTGSRSRSNYPPRVSASSARARWQTGSGVDSDCSRPVRADAPARQSTLRATLDWSHALLSRGEQRVHARVAVFAGGRTLEACEAVTSFDGIQTASCLEILSQLVTKSLVVTKPGPGGTQRYRLLETVRQYAGDQLDLSGERDVVSNRTDWYLAWVERIAATGSRPLNSMGILAVVGAD